MKRGKSGAPQLYNYGTFCFGETCRSIPSPALSFGWLPFSHCLLRRSSFGCEGWTSTGLHACLHAVVRFGTKAWLSAKAGKSLRTKLTLCLLFVCLVLSVPSVWAEEIIIGTGTSDWWFPLDTDYVDARTQTIYLADEIGGSCNITALALYVTQVPGQTMNNFTIRMKHTDLSVYDGSPNWESSGWTTIYQTNETITATGWVQFDFTTPFEYNGSQNLMIDISFSNDYMSYSGFCLYSTTSGNRTICCETYGEYGDPLAWSGTIPDPYVIDIVTNVKLIVESATQVAMPVFTPNGGTYNSEQNVVITCSTDGATIHYTTDGNDPTESDPVIASGSSVFIDHTLTLKAKAWKDGLDPSNIKSADYQLVVATPVFTPDGGYYNSEKNVVITCSTPGATIHYTTDGNDPTESDPTIVSGSSILIDHSLTLKAKAWKSSFNPSNTKSASYQLRVATPFFNPGGGNYDSEKNVVITCATAGATIHYTTDGSDPTESDPVIESGSSVLVDYSLTLKAKAWKGSLDPSYTQSANYRLIVATPVFTPDGGGYRSSEEEVMITCSTADAAIHYTTDGNDPTEGDPIIVSGGSVLVSIEPPTTLKARAWKTGLEPSNIKEAIYFYSLINNPSMEGNFIYNDYLGYVAEYWTGWSRGSYWPGYFNEDTYYAHHGTKSQEITWNGLGYESFGPDGIYQQISSLQPGRAYLVSVWFKYRFEPQGSGYGDITCSVGTDPDGGTNPDAVTNWKSVSDYSYYYGEDRPWLNVVTFFSPTGPTTTIFIKVDGGGYSEEECPDPPCSPAYWDAYCYIDDVVVHQIEIGSASSVEATSPVPANGAGYSEVTITVLDSNSNPVVGIPPSEIDVNCSGSGNVILGPDGPTDVNGQTTVRIASSVAETKTVGATVLGTVLSDTATVHFCESRHIKFRASDGTASDYFGCSVAIDGNTALVGAEFDDDNGSDSGSAYIFRFNGSSWVQEAKLLASDGAASDYFGYSVAIDGNTALVGAYGDDDNGNYSGSAYIFRFNGSSWVQQAKLLASDGAANDDFGSSVAIDGNTALIGAPYNYDNGYQSGSAYIFRFNGSTWVQQAKLLASDRAFDDYFGRSVAIDGNTALVGADGDDDKGSHSGSAYIFRFNGSSWVQQAKLLASDGAAYDCFGYSVAIDGNTALVGAYLDDDKGYSSGSAYIFRFNGSNWAQEAKLLASDRRSFGLFRLLCGHRR